MQAEQEQMGANDAKEGAFSENTTGARVGTPKGRPMTSEWEPLNSDLVARFRQMEPTVYQRKVGAALVESWRATLSPEELKLVDSGNYRIFVEDGQAKVAPIEPPPQGT